MLYLLAFYISYNLFIIIRIFFKVILVSVETENKEILKDWKLKILIQSIIFTQSLLVFINYKFLTLLPLFIIINAVTLVFFTQQDNADNVWNEMLIFFKNQKKNSKLVLIFLCIIHVIKNFLENFIF